MENSAQSKRAASKLGGNESPRSKLRGINPQSKSCCPADSFRCKQRGIEPKEIKHAELELLSQSFLFADLPKKRVLAALKNCQCLRLPEKKEVYRRGETGEEMCIVLSGGVKVSTHSADGKEIIFDLLSEGDFFGELSLLDGGPRTATVTTLVPSVLAVLGRDFFMPFLEDNPLTAIRLLHLLAHRLRATDTFLEEVLFFDSETRLAKRVMALENIYGKMTGNAIQIEFKVSQQDIANLVGITRERVNKLLKKWERAKIISLQQGCLTIQDPALLQKLASKAGRLNLFGSNSPPLAANELTKFGLIPRSLLRGCSLS